jgi:polyphosphate kinase
MLRLAAADPDVLAIKMTLYRAGANSEAVKYLIQAAENGKQVAVSLELQARFDEANNISWARAFDRAGVHVFFGAAGVKTHAKMLLIVRREKGSLRRYVHVGTGNYNASTAKLYTDLGLFTADPAICDDACELFNMLSGFSRPSRFVRLAVAPLTLRSTILGKIGEQADRARAGKPARVFAKLNALVDPDVIRALYAASQAGVDIELVVRGICCLRPGLAGVSERIRVISLLGRFLEHERVYAFGPEGAEQIYIGSADWMPRNLDRRVELIAPVASERVRDRIRAEAMRPLQHDGAIYVLEPSGAYRRFLAEAKPLPVAIAARSAAVVAELAGGVG